MGKQILRVESIHSSQAFTAKMKHNYRIGNVKMSFTISRNGQLLKMKLGAYRLTKVTDGNGRRLPSGAKLFIPEESGRIYFDFNKPKSGLEFQWIDIVKANTVFLLITAACYYLYHRYLTVNKIK